MDSSRLWTHACMHASRLLLDCCLDMLPGHNQQPPVQRVCELKQ